MNVAPDSRRAEIEQSIQIANLSPKNPEPFEVLHSKVGPNEWACSQSSINLLF